MKIRLPHPQRVLALSLMVLASAATGSRADLSITEIMAVADLGYPDEDGEPSDWIEITNNGAAAASLAGHYLTNSAGDLTRWAFPAESVAAGQSIVVFASGKDRATLGSELHASFTLDRSGDYLALIAPDGATPVSEISPGYPEQFAGISYGFGASGGTSLETFIARGASMRYHIALDDSLGDTWWQPAPAFDDSTWASALAPIGYESGVPPSGLWEIIATGIKAEMQNVNASGYFRFPFNFDGSSRSVSELLLKIWIDDGFVAYLNGTEVGDLLMPDPLLWNSSATGSRPGGDTTARNVPVEFDLSAVAALVVDGDNVLAVQGANTAANSSDFLLDAELVAEAVDTSGGLSFGYFEDPTPSAPNKTNLAAPPAEVVYSEPSQLFTDEITLTLSCETPGALIRYTTDLSEPTGELDGTAVNYSGPLTISSTTQVRARAFLAGALPGPAGTGTFLKMDTDVEPFSSDLPVVVLSTLGTGTPFASNSTDRRDAYLFFFEPDPVTGRTTLTQMPQVVTRGGVRKRGSSSANWPKYGMSVEAWEDIGRDLDGDGEIDLHEEIDNNIEPFGFAREADWILNSRYEFDKALMRNPLIYDLSRQVGRYAARSQFVELYNDVDGGTVDANDYFGVYSLMEKIEADPNRVEVERLMPWHNSAPEVTGGYIFKRDRNDAGNPPTYSVSGAGGSLIPHDPGGEEVSAQQKTYIQGYLNEMNVAILNRPSGLNNTTGLHWSDYLDIDSWIDHHWLNTLAMNVDWGRLSAYYHKDRNGRVQAGPIWDFDRNMGSSDVRDDNPRTWDGSNDSSKTWFDSRYPWFGNLIGPAANPATAYYPDVRQQHTDRWFEMRAGALANANIVATIDSMADELREAQARSFARWPNLPNGNPGSFNGPSFAVAGTAGWEAEVSHIKGWMTARADWIDDQYLAPPAFSQAGGVVADGFVLTMNSPDGAVYYTVDGSDPRASGGAPSAGSVASGSVSLSGVVVVTARTLSGGEWSAPTREGFIAGAVAADTSNLVVSEINYRPAAPSAAEEAEGFNSRGQFEFLEVLNVGIVPVALLGVTLSDGAEFDFDDGAIAQLAVGERALVVRDAAAFEFRYGATAAARVAGEFGGGTGLSNGGERLLLAGTAGTIHDFTYDDSDPWPTAPDGDGYALELIAPEALPDHALPESWQSSAVLGGTPGAAGGEGFADWSAVNGGVATGDDGDQDGRIALLEFAGGGDPLAPEPAGDYFKTRVESLEVAGVTSDYLTIRIRKNLAALGVALVPETSTDLENWSDAGSSVVLVEEDNLGDGTALVKYRTATPLAGLAETELFLRSRVKVLP